LIGCNEEGRLDHIDDNAPAPLQIGHIKVRNTPGGAVLKYTVPADENLLYVRAEYEIQPGVMRETMASYFKDSLVLEGFGDTRTYNVKVYSVGRNEKTSAPLTVKVTPLTPPVHMATKILREGFGAVIIQIENPEKANLAIELMGDIDHLGYHIPLQTYYTSREKASFAYRGLDTTPKGFSVYLRDRWSNLSDTITTTLTPWFEEYIPKNTWKVYPLPTDSWQPHPTLLSSTLDKAWDDNTGSIASGCFVNAGDTPVPMWVTWDLGVPIIMSRLKIWTNYTYVFSYGSPKKFELYGSTNPNQNGIWDDSWIPLGQFEILIPSGQETPTNDDIAIGRAGFDFDLEESEFAPDPFVPIRYIRYKAVSTWSGASNIAQYLNEISFWGQVIY